MLGRCEMLLCTLPPRSQSSFCYLNVPEKIVWSRRNWNQNECEEKFPQNANTVTRSIEAKFATLPESSEFLSNPRCWKSSRLTWFIYFHENLLKTRKPQHIELNCCKFSVCIKTNNIKCHVTVFTFVHFVINETSILILMTSWHHNINLL